MSINIKRMVNTIRQDYQIEIAKTLFQTFIILFNLYVSERNIIMSNPDQKRAIRRLMCDLSELKSSPIANVAAVPLEGDMFEWHCNIIVHGQCYHMILMLPDTYPIKAPGAEMLPKSYRMVSGAYRAGKKGVEICIELFSNYIDMHGEWDNALGRGWSSAYTIQSVLLNLITFLEDFPSENHIHVVNSELAKQYECPDCGHTNGKPYPAFVDPHNSVETTHCPMDTEETVTTQSHITPTTIVDNPIYFVDYMSKKAISLKNISTEDDVIGFGVYEEEKSGESKLSTPGELISAESYNDMFKCKGFAESTDRHRLISFIPCLINSENSQIIQTYFEDGIKKLKIKKELAGCFFDSAIDILSELLSSSLEQCIQQRIVSDNLVQSLFMIHHLFLWLYKSSVCVRDCAMSQQDELKNFMEESTSVRTKKEVNLRKVLLLSCTTSERLVWHL